MWVKRRRGTDITTSTLYQWFRAPRTPGYGDVWVRPPFPNGTCLIVGHRGSSYTYPENTMLAFTKSVEEGAGAIEADVRRSADGVYLIMHDTTVDRTTNGTGTVSGLTWDYISGLDAGAWKGSEFADREDTKVPRLDDLLDHFQGVDVFLLLHLALSEAQARQVVDMVMQRDMIHQCLMFISTGKATALKAYRPNAYVINSGTSNDPDDIIPTAIAGGWDGVSTSPELWTTETVQLARGHGLIVQGSVITNNFADRMLVAVEKGINVILGDDPASMLAVVPGLEQWKPRKGGVHVRGLSDWTQAN